MSAIKAAARGTCIWMDGVRVVIDSDTPLADLICTAHVLVSAVLQGFEVMSDGAVSAYRDLPMTAACWPAMHTLRAGNLLRRRQEAPRSMIRELFSFQPWAGSPYGPFRIGVRSAGAQWLAQTH